MLLHAVDMGVDRWGMVAWWGPCDIGNVPPFFCLKTGKSCVFLSSSNLHSFVSLRNRRRLVEIASGHIPGPHPPPIYAHGCTTIGDLNTLCAASGAALRTNTSIILRVRSTGVTNCRGV